MSNVDTQNLTTHEWRRDLLIGAGSALFGGEWQRAIARTLGPLHPGGSRDAIDDRLVRRWAAGERPIPNWVFPALVKIIDTRATELDVLLIRLSKEVSVPADALQALRDLIRAANKSNRQSCMQRASKLVDHITPPGEDVGLVTRAARRVLDKAMHLFNSIPSGTLDEICRHDALDAIDRLELELQNTQACVTSKSGRA